MVTSYRPLFRQVIAAKLDCARESEPHMKYLESMCNDLKEAKLQQDRVELAKLRRLVAIQLQEAVPAQRLARLQAKGREKDADVMTANARKEALEWQFYHSVRASLEHQERSHADAVHQHRQRALVAAIVPGLYLTRLLRHITRSAGGTVEGSRGPPPVSQLRAALSRGHSTLARYINARESRVRLLRTRLLLLVVITNLHIRGRRARVVVATRMIKQLLSLLSKSAKSFVAVRRFHDRVVRAQRIARDFIACLQARRHLIQVRIERLYYGMWLADPQWQKDFAVAAGNNTSSKAVTASSKKPSKVAPSKVAVDPQTQGITAKSVRHIVPPLDARDIAVLVAVHTRALRTHNGAAKAKFVSLKVEYGEQRRQYRLQFAKQRAAAVALAAKYNALVAPADWRAAEAFIAEHMAATKKPVCETLKAVPPADVVLAQLRGILARQPKYEGMPNPTAAMIVVQPKELAALTSFNKKHDKKTKHAHLAARKPDLGAETINLDHVQEDPKLVMLFGSRGR